MCVCVLSFVRACRQTQVMTSECMMSVSCSSDSKVTTAGSLVNDEAVQSCVCLKSHRPPRAGVVYCPVPEGDFTSPFFPGRNANILPLRF